MKRFYTVPYIDDYPYILVPFTQIHLLKKRDFKHAIIDAGVEIFAHGAKEYPKNFFNRYEFKTKQLTEIYGERLWCVIPDYPDDYRNNPIPDNVHRTLVNIERFHKVQGVNWIYPLQSDYLDLNSFHYCCHKVMKYQPERVAIGTVCKTHNHKFIVKACELARKHFPDAHIHAFGPTLSVLPQIIHFIDSWDSTAWEFNCRINMFKQRKKKTKSERLKAFNQYLNRINQIIEDYHKQKRLFEKEEKFQICEDDIHFVFE